ncbi:MAG: hypothetical protein JWP77_2674 [Polaromonas sp.]|jgi:hypothetical protein|nr:hypothetical protein [Polaromonas sp.]
MSLQLASKLPQFPNVSLLPLPAGSPKLNPNKQVRQHCTTGTLTIAAITVQTNIGRLQRRLECLHANPWRHPLFLIALLGHAAFGIGHVMVLDWIGIRTLSRTSYRLHRMGNRNERNLQLR